MPARERWWLRHWEGLGGGKFRCRECSLEMDARGGGTGRHTVEVHGVKEPVPAGPTEPSPAAAPVESVVPDLSAMTLDANLAALLRDATDQSAPLHARVMARKAIMEALGQFDSPPEEDVAERRRKWMEAHEDGLKSIEAARAVVREELSDPVVRGAVKQILAEVDS